MSAAGAAQADDLTLCWAAWDPANALVELSEGVRGAVRPQDELRVRALAELRRPDAERAELGRRPLRPDDRRQPVDRRRRRERATTSSSTTSSTPTASTWTTSSPPPSPAIPNGRRARRTTGRCRPSATWSAGPTARTGSSGRSCRPSSRRSTAATSPPPTTFAELKDIAEFFQGREIDGKTVYGAAIYTERGSEGITMGAMDVLYSFGFEYENPDKPYELDGFVNSPGVGRGPRVLQGALRLLHPAGRLERLHDRGHRRLQVGPGGAADELRLHLAGRERRPERRRRQDRLLPQPGRARRRPVRPARRPGHLGRRGTRDSKDAALEYIKWFAQPEVQAKWWKLGGYSALNAVVNDPGFATSQPYAQTFLDSMAIVKDFWAEPELRLAARRPRSSASTTTSSPATAPRRRRSTGWSRTGPRSSRTTARCERRGRRCGGTATARRRRPAPRALPANGRRHVPDLARLCRARRRRSRSPAACAACRTGRSPGSSSRRRSRCCSRSTSSR